MTCQLRGALLFRKSHVLAAHHWQLNNFHKIILAVLIAGQTARKRLRHGLNSTEVPC